ncbi:MAG TPA: hypothetical protein PK385_02730 [Spirochaetota bacterium]|nr:hypothetical protein [Spirochaetota bacterium]HOS31712.1 hypothetical protein [Spirochaetota bacterium]HOS54953.1 hypothetical protein [Spirochaetota bacterium]HPK61274.1 hypothetical protein [Spirochaetota bacterium]HQF78801.1 hypothetical protein [Spirochaetota bacterium]
MSKNLLFLIFMLFLTAYLRAEIVVLQDGTVVKGQIQKTESDKIYLQTEYGEVTISKDKVKNIFAGETEYNNSIKSEYDKVESELEKDAEDIRSKYKTKVKSKETDKPVEEKKMDEGEYYAEPEQDPLYIAYRYARRSGTALLIPGIIVSGLSITSAIAMSPIFYQMYGSSLYYNNNPAYFWNPITGAMLSSILVASVTGLIFLIACIPVYVHADSYLKKLKQKYGDYDVSLGYDLDNKLNVAVSVKF